MAEFDKAKVWSHMCRGPFHFINGLLDANAVVRGVQQMTKTPVAIASVQVTQTSMREAGFTETVRAPNCFLIFLRWSRNATIRK